MFEKWLTRQGEDIVLQLFEIVDSGQFPSRLRVAQDEVAEAEVFSHRVAQIDIHLLRIFVNEVIAKGIGPNLIFSLGRFHDERHVGVGVADGLEQAETGIGLLLLFGRIGALGRGEREAAVGDDAKDIGHISLIE